MILAVDVDYRDTKAIVAGLCFDNWEDEKAAHIYRSVISKTEAYEPGSFYKRELPCILQLLKEHPITPDVIVIDGFVYLGNESRPGLGMHLYNKLGQATPVVGVAKKAFIGTAPDTAIRRGKSSQPLFVTAVGMDLDSAKNHVLSMHGDHRIPTLLKAVDRECRGD